MSDDRGRQIAAGAQIYKCEQQSGDTLFDLAGHSLIPVGKPERCVDSEHAANPGEPRAIAQIRDTVHQVAAVHKLLSEGRESPRKRKSGQSQFEISCQHSKLGQILLLSGKPQEERLSGDELESFYLDYNHHGYDNRDEIS